jgi:hypothetical protein
MMCMCRLKFGNFTFAALVEVHTSFLYPFFVDTQFWPRDPKFAPFGARTPSP